MAFIEKKHLQNKSKAWAKIASKTYLIKKTFSAATTAYLQDYRLSLIHFMFNCSYYKVIRQPFSLVVKHSQLIQKPHDRL